MWPIIVCRDPCGKHTRGGGVQRSSLIQMMMLMMTWGWWVVHNLSIISNRNCGTTQCGSFSSNVSISSPWGDPASPHECHRRLHARSSSTGAQGIIRKTQKLLFIKIVPWTKNGGVGCQFLITYSLGGVSLAYPLQYSFKTCWFLSQSVSFYM